MKNNNNNNNTQIYELMNNLVLTNQCTTIKIYIITYNKKLYMKVYILIPVHTIFLSDFKGPWELNQL